jgi:hypothetical protein
MADRAVWEDLERLRERLSGGLSTLNGDQDPDDVLVVALGLEAVCASCSTLERSNFLCEGAWSILLLALKASQPTDELLQFKPKVSSETMAHILAAARTGERVNSLPCTNEAPSRGALLLQHWNRVRRATMSILRNAMRFPDGEALKESLAQPELVRYLGRMCSDASEEGVNVSYALTTLRFLLPSPEGVSDPKVGPLSRF